MLFVKKIDTKNEMRSSQAYVNYLEKPHTDDKVRQNYQFCKTTDFRSQKLTKFLRRGSVKVVNIILDND